MTRFLKLTNIALALLLVGPTVYGKGGKHWFRDLDLNKEQKEKIHKIRKASRDSMKNQREAIHALREKLTVKFQSDASEAELRALFTNLQDLHQSKMKSHFEKFLKIRAILTPEQRKKFKPHLGKHGKMGRRGREGRKHRRMWSDDKDGN